MLKEIYCQKGVCWRRWTDFRSILSELHLLSCSSHASLQASLYPVPLLRTMTDLSGRGWKNPGRTGPAETCLSPSQGQKEARGGGGGGFSGPLAKQSEHLCHWDVQTFSGQSRVSTTQLYPAWCTNSKKTTYRKQQLQGPWTSPGSLIQTDARHLHKPGTQKGVFTFLHNEKV